MRVFPDGDVWALPGKQLAQLSGVAAVLRYPMPELEEEDDPQRLLREYAPELVTS